ncbi:MAG: hypothetical protein RBT63_03570 [Bdellovibrionales bacterium]|jgi:23S rRNA (uracil1939-C5)-methyltransferase|nr:hypothetical protein [Bdellovibrionales bacterium]
MSTLNCPLSQKCSGCDLASESRESLAEIRSKELADFQLPFAANTAPQADFVWIAASGLRDRLEFTLSAPHFGLFEKSDVIDSKPREIVDIAHCPILSDQLNDWLEEFRKDLPPIRERRSIRLRVSPTGLRGVWLDLSNEDIRDLLDEGAWLQRRLDDGVIVEMGQKRKRVIKNPERKPDSPRAHRLADPVLEPWFETYSTQASSPQKGEPLYGTIGTFTQPGFRANHALVRTVLEHLTAANKGSSHEIKHIAEFGAGIGNFTIPLLATGARVDVFESDRLALEALKLGVAKADDALKQPLSKNLTIHAGDFILSARASERALGSASNSHRYDLVFVDPPRSGLGRFTDAIHSHAANAAWLYVSCYPESFARDARALAEKGLAITRLTVVEQFPFTKHFEIVATFQRVI